MDDTKLKEERRKYYISFNDTMVRIWKEKIVLLGVWRTGDLYRSVLGLKSMADVDYTSLYFEQAFNIYGLYVNYGTGSNTPRGNSGDLGAGFVNRRRKKKWFSKKYFRSVMNIQEFMADNLAKDCIEVFSNAINAIMARRSFSKK